MAGRFRGDFIVLVIAAAVFLGCIASPPALMDDMDSVQAQIARNMLDSGDWVTPHLDGIKYLEKAPLKYWLIALSFKIFGERDWAARLPVALAAVLVCWLAYRTGRWAFSPRAGVNAGVILATCVGMFLFTRVQIPDVMLTAAISLALWSFLRALDPQEARPGVWAGLMAASIGVGLLLKGLIAAVFPIGAAGLFLLFTGEWRRAETWRRLHIARGAIVALAIAAPWHALATLRNPPYFDFTLHSPPGQYRGFFWFYFINEHVLRFLNLRYPRDYNTVPRLSFWLFHLLWLFPWSVYFPAVATLSFGVRIQPRPSGRGSADRASRMRLLCLCWAGFILVFFTFSSTQEYYSMPAYPALALLLASALDQDRALGTAPPVRAGFRSSGNWIRKGNFALAGIAGVAAFAIVAVLVRVWNLPAPGDISRALVAQDPQAYTLSLAHLGDLTLASFAYLKPPLILAGIACAAGALLLILPDRRWNRLGRFPLAGGALMMVLFVHAARLALVTFDPYLSSRALAEALNRAPAGTLILDDQYYTFSSVVFYAQAYRGKPVLLLNGRVNNLEYGSWAPGAPASVFIRDGDFRERWRTVERYYICVEQPQVERLRQLAAPAALYPVAASGGKFVFSNRPVA
ncbi:MAG TPA: glycosyltransferase family 39 protein [Bryobacteraceae bacterium]